MSRWIRGALLILLFLIQTVWAAEPSLSGGDGPPSWGWLGVRIRDLSEQEMEELTILHGLQEGYGVVLVEVLKGGPAEAGGVKTGDLVVGYDGRPVVEVRELQRFVGETPAGKSVSLTLLRDGKRRTLPVTIGVMPADVVAERVAAEYGFMLRSPLRGEGASTGRDDDAVVAAVMDRSPAKQAGLHAGDQIVRVNGQAVTSFATLESLLRRQPLRQPLVLQVLRQGQTVSLRLPPALPEKVLQ